MLVFRPQEASCHVNLELEMAASIPNKPMDSVNYSDCEYSSITGVETCAGTKKDGSKCGKMLAVVVR
ncbi:hypothetical protein SBOR_0055 [Sclerotinia borealis F-4128]|uniref:Uncharacterized protein n=1 Tax=Sclerotinia borealis (strain F-4128) TaxID=1432307 RepID=W9CXY6_SCLBF|nr:hypothetical protein SBOR_0055 [Sclerotinia borealis F-4128]